MPKMIAFVGIMIFGLCAVAVEPGPEPLIGEYEGVCRLLGYPDFKVTGVVVSEGVSLYRTFVRFTAPDGSTQPNAIEVHGQKLTSADHARGYGGRASYRVTC